ATQEHWTGSLLSADEGRARTGIDTILLTSELEPFLASMLTGREFGPISVRESARFAGAVSTARAKLYVALDPDSGLDDPVPFSLYFGRRLHERFPGFDIVDATPAVAALRSIKTSYERQLLIKSFEISREAQVAGLHDARPGAYEYEVKAAIEAVHRR